MAVSGLPRMRVRMNWLIMRLWRRSMSGIKWPWMTKFGMRRQVCNFHGRSKRWWALLFILNGNVESTGICGREEAAGVLSVRPLLRASNLERSCVAVLDHYLFVHNLFLLPDARLYLRFGLGDALGRNQPRVLEGLKRPPLIELPLQEIVMPVAALTKTDELGVEQMALVVVHVAGSQADPIQISASTLALSALCDSAAFAHPSRVFPALPGKELPFLGIEVLVTHGDTSGSLHGGGSKVQCTPKYARCSETASRTRLSRHQRA